MNIQVKDMDNRELAQYVSTKWLEHINESDDSQVEDIRCEQPEVEQLESGPGFIMFPNASWRVHILKDQAYDLSTGYTLPCINYDDAEMERREAYEAYERGETDHEEQPEGFTYWVKCHASFYEAGNSYGQDGYQDVDHLYLDMYVCLNGEYGQDYDPGFGSGRRLDMTRGGWEKTLSMSGLQKLDEAQLDAYIEGLADLALASFADKAECDDAKDNAQPRLGWG